MTSSIIITSSGIDIVTWVCFIILNLCFVEETKRKKKDLWQLKNYNLYSVRVFRFIFILFSLAFVFCFIFSFTFRTIITLKLRFFCIPFYVRHFVSIIIIIKVQTGTLCIPFKIMMRSCESDHNLQLSKHSIRQIG